jgi:hypothetical protein
MRVPATVAPVRHRSGSPSATTAATTVKPTAHQNATRNPVLSTTTASTAVPNEPPTCCAVRVTMLACGMSRRSRFSYALAITGTVTPPSPIPRTTRAGERGEIDLARLTPRVANLATDLLRHELLMTHRPVPRRTIVEIVLPLFPFHKRGSS